MFINGIAIFFIVAQKKDDCWTKFKRVTQFYFWVTLLLVQKQGFWVSPFFCDHNCSGDVSTLSEPMQCLL